MPSSLMIRLVLCVSLSTLAVAIVPRAKAPAPASLTATAISQFKKYTYYAAAAYCSSDVLKIWACGGNCEHTPDYTPIAAGGDGNAVQNWFVGYDSALQSIIVGHQGTDPTQFLAVLTDVNAFLTRLPATFFGIPTTAQVHKGFLTEHTLTAPLVLSAVNASLTKFSTKQVTIVGHSLGAALALLDAAYLKSALPFINIKIVTYGMPRVGNPDFAAWIDANIPDLQHINNRIDPVPIVPGRSLGYAHPSGEIHITERDAWLACTGQDSIQTGCTLADNNNVLTSNILNHLGPYDGVLMGLCWLNGKRELPLVDRATAAALSAKATA